MQEVYEKYLKGLKLAIVDDSRAFGAGIRGMAVGYFASVEVFQDARVALAQFLVSPPDIIITDLEMPDFDGFQLIAAVRENPAFQDIPILVLTGKEDTATMLKIIGAGADQFVAKSQVREVLVVHLLALARVREAYKSATQGKQLDAVKALIGTYKHEFGNAIAAIDGKLRKIKKVHPQLTEDESYLALVKWTGRLIETLQKLDELRRYEEQKYVGNAQMMKTG